MNKINKEALKSPERFIDASGITESELDLAINDVIKKVKHNIVKLGETFPESSTINDTYRTSKNIEWTPGFWTGILWLCYENTHEEIFRSLAEKNVESFYQRIKNQVDVNHHDLGFLYIPSCVAAYKLTGNKLAKDAALLAADKLMERYNPKGKFIQAWGNVGDSNNYRLIVDAMLNIPLLYWAYQETGTEKYLNVVKNHYETTLKYAIREDGSAYHTFFFDPQSGKPIGGRTRQGYSDDSSWARGQSWLIYGIALNYSHLHNDVDLDTFESVTNYFLNRLPEDFVSYWDLIFKDGDYQSKDSSATAIAICGMNQMQKYLDKNNNIYPIYEKAQGVMLHNLINSYTEEKTQGITALLNHGVYSWHSGHGIDEGNLWGDYFYLEALTRFKQNGNWEMYW
ncbi:glycoside hydrolase family 88 protein [Lactobacillus hominis]|uniref:glycoside hydrolase family 88 protein n=1 Tax=Lactobacillus hominis TaxID=1203033 RepID=UPI0023EFC02E|nr:glycoside hydrolase family 88 protein [Lactobacillus hominis]